MDSTLDLEELDLEALKDLPGEEPPTLPEVPAIPEGSYAQQPEEQAAEPPTETAEAPPTPFESPLAAEPEPTPGEPFEEETLAIPGLAMRAQVLSAQQATAADFPVQEFLTEDIPAHEPPELGEAPDLGYLTPEIPPAETPSSLVFEEVPPQHETHEEAAFPSAAEYALPAAALALPAVSAMQLAEEPPELPTPPAPVAPPVPVAPESLLASVPPSLPAWATGGEAPRDAAALVQVLMSDPAVMDALAKAVVARLGDQALREIAWELMPELAEKLPR
jgi:hypothetical protein